MISETDSMLCNELGLKHRLFMMRRDIMVRQLQRERFAILGKGDAE